MMQNYYYFANLFNIIVFGSFLFSRKMVHNFFPFLTFLNIVLFLGQGFLKCGPRTSDDPPKPSQESAKSKLLASIC